MLSSKRQHDQAISSECFKYCSPSYYFVQHLPIVYTVYQIFPQNGIDQLSLQLIVHNRQCRTRTFLLFQRQLLVDSQVIEIKMSFITQYGLSGDFAMRLDTILKIQTFNIHKNQIASNSSSKG